MSTKVISLIAIGLWVATLAVAAVFFVRGQTTTSAEGRQAIVLAPAQRDLVLSEMRTMLASVQGVIRGIADNDARQVAQAARQSGMAAAVDVAPELMTKLPLEFKQLGTSTHKSFDGLAQLAESGAPPEELLARLDTHMSACIACHASYRLEAAATDAK